MSQLSELLHELVLNLTPVHLAESRFGDGGYRCARDIAHLYEQLVWAEALAHEIESRSELPDEEDEQPS
jgi:hypothetical protein